MHRARVVFLSAVCAVLVLDGVSVAESGAAPGLEDGAGFDANRIATIVHRVNPSLTAEQQRRIGDAVMRNSAKYDLDPQLVTAVVLVESSARPWARSDKGAVGLMQVMPHMVRSMDLAGNLTTIEANIEAGCIILAGNIRRLGEEDGISAYFWGSRIRGVAYLDRVQKARARVRELSSES
jgi:soluble lytic murein transglycosylase-like protein